MSRAPRVVIAKMPLTELRSFFCLSLVAALLQVVASIDRPALLDRLKSLAVPSAPLSACLESPLLKVSEYRGWVVPLTCAKLGSRFWAAYGQIRRNYSHLSESERCESYFGFAEVRKKQKYILEYTHPRYLWIPDGFRRNLLEKYGFRGFRNI